MEHASQNPNLEKPVELSYDEALRELIILNLEALNPEALPEVLIEATEKAVRLLGPTYEAYNNGDITSFTVELGIRVGYWVIDLSLELHDTTPADVAQNERNAAKKAAREALQEEKE